MPCSDTKGISCRKFISHGDGSLDLKKFSQLGTNVVFERGVRIFHPEHIKLGNNVYIGHRAYLKAYFKNKLMIGNNVWIGQDAFLHAGGGIIIEDGVGIGPYVKIITLEHEEGERDIPVLYLDQKLAPVHIEYGVDIGIGSIILPGVTIGKNSLIGAGAVVTNNIPSYSVAVGVPARVIRTRS